MQRSPVTLSATAVVVAAVLIGCSSDGHDPVSDIPALGVPDHTTAPAEPTPTPADEGCGDPPCYGDPIHLGVLPPEVVEQVSGMSESHRNPGLFYAVSDVPGTSEVAVIEDDGTLVAHVEIDGMDARDAEALAVGPCGPTSDETCLFIGDIGNHVGLEDLFVYRVVEPDLADPPASVPADRLRYTYPGTPTDAEALLVDHDGRPLIVTKARHDRDTGTTAPTHLYRGARDGGALEDLGEIDLPEPQNAFFAGLAGHVVTGADAHDGRVLLRTYDEVYEYRSPDPDADLGTFPDWPVRRVPAPFQVQSETVAYRASGCGYLTTSELTGSIDAVDCE